MPHMYARNIFITLLFLPFIAFAAEPSVFTVRQGGTGSSTLTGILIGNGTSPIQTLTVGSNLTLSGTTLSSTGGGGFAFPFTPSSYAGVPNQSTTSPLWLNGTQLIASSTMMGNGSVSAPSLSFAESTDMGLYRRNSGYLSAVVSGVEVLGFTTTQLTTRNAMNFGFSSTADPGDGADTAIGRNAAGILEVNNGSSGILRDILLRNASTTGISSTNASTTNQVISSNFTFGGVTGNDWTDFCTTITGAAELCDGSDASGSGGSSAYEIATTSDIGVSQLAYFSKTGGRTTLASAATSSVTCSGGVSCLGLVALGASPSISSFIFPFSSASYGVSTSTIVGFLGGMFSVGSSTIQDLRATTFTLGTLSGGLGANGGTIYAGATTTAGTGLTYTNGAFDVNLGTSIDLASAEVTGDLAFSNLAQIGANSVLVNQTGGTADVAGVATTTFGTTLYGLGTPGQVLMWSGTTWTPSATATCAQITGGADLCDGSDATGGGFGFPFTSTASNSIVSTSTILALVGGLSVGTTSQPFASLYVAPGASTAHLLDIATTSAAFATSSVFRINAAGIVGIGTTTPGKSAKFGVTGDAFFSGEVFASNVTDTALTGDSCVGESSGLLNTNNCVTSISQTFGSAQSGVITLATSTTAISGDWGITNSSGTFTFNIPSSSATNRGLLIAADWTTFNGKESVLTFSTPLNRSGNTINWSGLATSTAMANTQIAYGTAVNTLGSEAAFTYNATTDLFTTILASTTQLSAATEKFYVNGSGKIQGQDTTNNWSGAVSPTRSFVLGTGTTTTWTASTTGTAYSPRITMPFTGTLRQTRCSTDASFVGVNVTVNASNATPSYFVASTTVGKVGFTAGNTFSAGQVILANFGTTTTSLTKDVTCTFDVTETP